MNREAIVLLSLTAVVAALAAGLAFVVLRLFAAAKGFGRTQHDAGAETAFVTAAMEEAVARLKLREQAIVARAEASERLSDEIIASLTSGLLVVDDDRTVKSLNPAGRRMLGLPEKYAGGTIDALLRNAQPLAQVIDECMTSGQPIRRRAVRIEPYNDRPTHLGVTVSPIGTDPSVQHGAICLFSDLTDVVELEEQLRLKDGLAQVGELTAGIAHEFRNGLATIHGYARLLDLDRLPPDMRAYVTGIREETDTLGAVVRNFLNFAKPTELVLGKVDIRAVVERAAEDIRAEATANGGSVAVRGEFLRVQGDEVLLRQAFSNLCRNALEACREAKIPPQILIEAAHDPGQPVLRISVIDNGPGVDPGLASRIFQPFVTTRARGTGLGLAVVQKIIVTHNGRVTVQAEPGGGTRFIVSLPAVG
ncbi:MAG TPA: ATP-binding protein [Vicinamibacterales bacterium]|nr:ATP-binding protein [Vicinamibacterales bacterium]